MPTAGSATSLGLFDDGGDNPPEIDLAPVLEALTLLTQQGSQLIDLLSRPAETAGNELNQRAAMALSHGWFEEALRDASKSIDQYPFRASAHLTGACAAVRLGRGEQAMQMLSDCVKYSANGEPEVGAVAALAAARLSAAVGVPQFAVPLLEAADRLTGSRCLPVVAALAYLTPSAKFDDILLAMWWAESGAEPSTPLFPGFPVPASRFPDPLTAPYAGGGLRFQRRAGEIREASAALDNAIQAVQSQSAELEKLLNSDKGASDIERLLIQLGGGTSWRPTLRKILGRLGALDDPSLPRAERFRFRHAESLAALRMSLRFTRRSAALLSDLFALDFGRRRSDLPSTWATRESGAVIGITLQERSLSLLDKASTRTIPASPADLAAFTNLAPASESYEALLSKIVTLADSAGLDALEEARFCYVGITDHLEKLTPLALPVGALLALPDPSHQ